MVGRKFPIAPCSDEREGETPDEIELKNLINPSREALASSSPFSSLRNDVLLL